MRSRKDEGGAAILVAASIVLLIGMVGVAIDGGLAYNERRGTQNASDNAALAAAWAACQPGGDPIAAGYDAAEDNGYIDADDPNSIDVKVTNAGANTYHVVITKTDDTNFTGVIGTDQVTVVSEATAKCTQEGGLGGYALFAGAPATCGDDPQINIPGSSMEINGNAHSNGSVASPGPEWDGKVWNGHVTYGPGGTASGVGYTEGNSQAEFQSYPVPDDWMDVTYWAPGGGRETADPTTYYSYTGDQNWTSTDLSNPGTYYIAGNVHLTDVNVTNATIVATGSVQFSGSTSTFGHSAYDDGLAVLSFAPTGYYEQGVTEVCDGWAIRFAASSNTYSGVFFAPNAQIRLNNAASLSLDGSLISYRINLAGASSSITYNNTFGGASQYTVELLR